MLGAPLMTPARWGQYGAELFLSRSIFPLKAVSGLGNVSAASAMEATEKTSSLPTNPLTLRSSLIWLCVPFVRRDPTELLRARRRTLAYPEQVPWSHPPPTKLRQRTNSTPDEHHICGGLPDTRRFSDG